jgi:site-specific DNA-methyltransferase (adenine-specific)
MNIELPTEADPVKVVCGRAEEALPALPDGCVDLVVTSPPYNLGAAPWAHLGHWKQGDSAGGKGRWRTGPDASGGARYAAHEDAMPWPEYVAWQRGILSSLWRKISDRGAIFYNHKPRVVGTRLWTPFELIPPEVQVRQIVIWARPGGLNYNPAAFVSTHEWVMLLAKPAFRLKSRAASGLGDVWKIAPDRNNPHPAPFPEELARRCIEPTRAELIVDPFGGSGTTPLAALREGRRCLVIEKDAGYCDIIRRRVSDARSLSEAG